MRKIPKDVWNRSFISGTYKFEIDNIHQGSSGQPRELLVGGGGVLGHGLDALRDSVLGQLSWKEEPHGRVDLPGGDGGLLFVVGQAAYTSISIIEM